MKTVIQVSNLSKVYKASNTIALNGISFGIQQEEIVGLIGNNGAGKTTTFHTLLGLQPPSTGNIHFTFGDKEKSFWKEITYLPEDNIFPTYLTGLEYLILINEIRHNRRINKKNILEALNNQNILDIDLLNKKVADYSKGNKRMLGIADALLFSPRIVFLDEPFEGLDPHNQSLIEKIILLYNKKRVTFIISTHSIEKIKNLCTQYIFLKRGKIVQQGPIAELDSQPERLLQLYEDPS